MLPAAVVISTSRETVSGLRVGVSPTVTVIDLKPASESAASVNLSEMYAVTIVTNASVFGWSSLTCSVTVKLPAAADIVSTPPSKPEAPRMNALKS